jgi:hypothetical protein
LAGGVFIPAASTYFAIAFIANFSGAVGDLWMLSQLARFHRFSDLVVIDDKAGVALYSNDPQARALAARLSVPTPNQSTFVNFWAWGSAGFFAFTLISGMIGSQFTNNFMIGPSWFPIASYHASEKGTSWSVSLIPPVVEGLVLAAITKLVSRRLKLGKQSCKPS